ncbi:UbiA prenyltransferase family protein [Rhodoflexus sp.]
MDLNHKTAIQATAKPYWYPATLSAYVQLLRPKHWIKNLFLFLPVFFAGSLYETDKMLPLLWGWLAFSLAASSIYVLNDYQDIAADRQHPEKCKRPLAAGTVSVPMAFVLFALLIAGSFGLAFWLHTKFLFILMIYVGLNVAYSMGLKHISILDIFIVALGFVLRVKAGGALTDIYVSEWLTIMIFLLALFLAITKRRDDLVIKAAKGLDVRKASKGYSLEFINLATGLITAVILVAYLTYTISPEVTERLGTHRVYYTFVFVLAGMLRYLQITFMENNSGSPVKILYRDRFIQACLVGWVLSFYALIYYRGLLDSLLV